MGVPSPVDFREQLLLQLEAEIPYQTAVKVEEMASRPGRKLFIRAAIIVDRPSQTGILIGAGGSRLQAIGRTMVAGFKSLGFDVGTAETPIVPLRIGDMEKTLLFWRALFDGGVFTNPVISPAVPPDSTLIRTSYMAIHTDAECDEILSIAGKAGKKLGIV